MATPPPLLQIGDTRNARVPSVEAARYITSKDRKERARTRRDTVRIYSCFIFWIFLLSLPGPLSFRTWALLKCYHKCDHGFARSAVSWHSLYGGLGWRCCHWWLILWMKWFLERLFFALEDVDMYFTWMEGLIAGVAFHSFFFCEFRICFRLYDMVRKEQFAIKAFY